MLAQPRELVGGRLLAVARRAQLLQALAQQIGGLGVVVDVIAKRGLEGELGRGVRPAADHLHQLDFEIAVVGQALRVLFDGEAPAKFAPIDDWHGVASPLHDDGLQYAKLKTQNSELIAPIATVDFTNPAGLLCAISNA